MTTGEMRAFVVSGPERSALADVVLPELGADDVLARVEAVGICGSDVELLEGRRPSEYLRYPIVPGHEWVGRVVAAGERVTNVRSGSAVVAEGIRGCGRCARCVKGRSNLCLNGYSETGFTEPGALANYISVPARLLHPLAEHVDYRLETAALIEPAACVATGLFGVGRLRRTDTVAIVGDGALGQIAVMLCARSSPSRLALFGTSLSRLELGVAHGATECGPPEAMLAPDNLGCYDVVFDASGSSDGAAAAIRLARRGGTVVLAGIAGTGTTAIDGDWISRGSLKVQGVFGSSSRAWRWLTRLWSAGELDFSALVTHRRPLSGTFEAFELAADPSRTALKVLVLPNAEEAQ